MPSAAPSPAATQKAGAAPAALPQVPASVMDKVREGTTSQDRQKTTIELAQEYFKDSKRDMAFALLERTTGENPQWIDALFLLATEYRKAGRLDPSSGALLRILQVEPTHALAYNNLGMIQMRKKKPKDAIPYLERSFVLKQDAPETPLNLGIAYEQTLTWGKAVAAYEHFLKLANPTGGLSKDKVINAVKFRMQRLKAFARAQGTLDQGLDATQLARKPKQAEESDDSDEGEDGELPLATGPVVDPNPIQQPKGNGSPAAAVVSAPPSPTAKERAPAGVQTQLPTQVKGEGAKP